MLPVAIDGRSSFLYFIKLIAILTLLVATINGDIVKAGKPKRLAQRMRAFSLRNKNVDHDNGGAKSRNWWRSQRLQRNSAQMRWYPFKLVTNKAGSHSRTRDTSIDVIKQAVLTLPSLRQLVNPIRTVKDLDGVVANNDMGRWRGTVRLQRLYCRGGIGYHLEIKKNGKVVASHVESPDGLLEFFSIEKSVVGIRSRARSRYLCMNKRGKLYTRKRTHPECQFREHLESNNYNTYASELYSNHKERRGYYLAISRSGKLKRGRRVSWKQKSAQWLPKIQV